VGVLPPSEREMRIRWFIYVKWGRWCCFKFLSFAFSIVDGGEI
jgi:hypothetical protein